MPRTKALGRQETSVLTLPLERNLSYDEGARLVGVSVETFKRIVARGEIPAIRVSPRRVVFRPNDIRAHLERCQVRR